MGIKRALVLGYWINRTVLTDSFADLYQVISENAPEAIKVGDIKNHFGRKVAIVRCSSLSHLLLASLLIITAK